MAGKATDRKGKTKESKSAAGPTLTEAALAAFTLPDSLSCSEVDFPVLIKRRAKANWTEILKESEKWQKEIEEYTEAKSPAVKPVYQKTECDYIQNEIFVHLIPALVETLNKAKLWDALVRQKCFFNGIDHIVQRKSTSDEELYFNKSLIVIFDYGSPLSQLDFRIAVNEFLQKIRGLIHLAIRLENGGKRTLLSDIETNSSRAEYNIKRAQAEKEVLWNNNPRHPDRKGNNLHLFNMPWVREELKIRPRPYYPKSWLWPEEYAATLIQKTVRQYFVQKQDEVAEMRDFWKKLEFEKHVPDMETNPFLAKFFAVTSQTLQKN